MHQLMTACGNSVGVIIINCM